MGLDAVEIVLRTEDLFAITLDDDEAAAVRTVGDFYRLICTKLDLAPLSSPITSAELPIITRKEKKLFFLPIYTPLPAPPEVLPWTPQTVWDTLVAVFIDQQGLERDEIRYAARIAQDLGVD
jgi:acyl carrier protein